MSAKMESTKENENDKESAMRVKKAAELERIRKNLEKRSLNVKFDLEGSAYQPIENIGVGAYGVVCSAIHKKSGDRVAIKKIPNVFEALTIAKRTYREIKILKHFKHDNIISIREILLPKENMKDFKDIYVVFDLMESDLHRIIYSDQPLSEEHIRYFLYQILRGLKYIHSANVVHRDLKPSNVLVNEDCHLRIGDFGMARGLLYTPNEPSYYMTQYVATRWYRAPEILLSMVEYGTAVDMWSVGCIFAEMLGRKHLFPGKDYVSQVKLVLGVLGTPSEAVLKNCQNDILRRIIKSLGPREPMQWAKLFPKASKKSLDLLGKMLVLSPEGRIPVERALSHRLLNHYHDPNDEPICVPTFNFDFEKQEMDKPLLRSTIMDEILSFHRPRPPTLSFSAFLRPAPKPGEISSIATEEKESASFVSGNKSEVISSGQKEESTNQKSVDIFKTPEASENESKPSTKKSPVSVDLSHLNLSTGSDVEMLSAQSSDGRAMDTQNSELGSQDDKGKAEMMKLPLEKKVEATNKIVKADGKKPPGKTISEDTKALVKQALMNATQRRQRAESQSEDVDRSKPITAAQRQKEREEKRRKKKERATKKSKDRKNVQEVTMTLSSQDLELLQRWKMMQNPGPIAQTSPPHPEPSVSPLQANNSGSIGANATVPFFATASTETNPPSHTSTSTSSKPRQIKAKITPSAVSLGATINISSSQINSGGTVIIPSDQFGLSQANFIPVIAIPSAVTPGHIEIKRVFQQPGVTMATAASGSSVSSISSESTTATSTEPSSNLENTKTLLQNAIFMRHQNIANGSQTAPYFNMSGSTNAPDTLTSQGVISLSSTATPSFASTSDSNNMDREKVMLASHPANSNSEMLKGEMKVDEKNKLSPLSQGDELLDFLTQQDMAYPSDTSPTQPGILPPPPPYPMHHQGHMVSHPPRSNSSPSLRQPLPSPDQAPHAHPHHMGDYSDPVFPRSFPNQSGFPSQQSFSALQEKHSESFPQINSSPSASQMFSSNHQGSETFSNSGLIYRQPSLPSQPMLPPGYAVSAENSQTQPQQHHPLFTNTTTTFELPGFGDPSPDLSTQIPFSHYSMTQDQNYSLHNSFEPGFVGGADPHAMGQQGSEQGHLPQTQDFRSLPDFGSGISQSSLHGRQQATSMSDGGNTRNPGSQLRVNCRPPSQGSESHADLIALISKQLSKSQVVDAFPPALALTPRGTGAGYGVGMDLDAMLTDAQENIASARLLQSPLSSSLLADWLDISGNISQQDLEALEREFPLQSPMSLSYDGNL